MCIRRVIIRAIKEVIGKFISQFDSENAVNKFGIIGFMSQNTEGAPHLGNLKKFPKSYAQKHCFLLLRLSCDIKPIIPNKFANYIRINEF